MLTRLTIEKRLALIIALLALLELWLTFQVREPSSFMAVGPRAFPYVLGGAMLLSAVLLFILPPRRAPAAADVEQVAAEHTDAAIVQGVSDEGEDAALEWRRVLALILLMAIYVLTFQPVGFVISTTIFIVAAARILGSRHLLRDTIVAVLVAGSIFYLFTQLLRVSLPGFPFVGS